MYIKLHKIICKSVYQSRELINNVFLVTTVKSYRKASMTNLFAITTNVLGASTCLVNLFYNPAKKSLNLTPKLSVGLQSIDKKPKTKK